MSYTGIIILPDSIYEMVNLRALILFGCRRLQKVGSLAKLDLGRNCLETLPDGIDKLIHLQEFNWTTSGGLGPGHHPAVSHLLANLVHLQCLILHDARLKDVRMEELSGLRKLEIFAISFSDQRNFNSYVRKQQHYHQRLTHYRLQLNGGGPS